MLFQRIEAEGLSHYSYLLGSGHKAIVIDPRRDIDIYLDMAKRNEHQISYVLETHRNEDYLVGSLELANRTGAEIWHADGQLPYQYGQAAEDGQEWELGDSVLRALATPGHTPGSMSYILSDKQGTPWMVFTGDALFAGEVGRTDLLGREKIPEMASLLYDSIFGRLLPLGDGVIVCPAHGSGSVCGSSISSRALTTIGIERLTNPRLKAKGPEDFVKEVGVELERPPYFKKMEEWNLSGPPGLGSLPEPKALSPDVFAQLAPKSVVLDSRFEGFGAAHVPGSVCIWLDGIPSFAGWFIPYDRPILLIGDPQHLDTLVRYLVRLGYDRIAGYLAGGILAWHMAGRETESIDMITVAELCQRLDSGSDTWILDVRSQDELDQDGEIPSAYHLHITELASRSGEIPQDRPVFIFCGSGLRSMVAASLLQRRGWRDLTVVLGGFAAWTSVRCPIGKTKRRPNAEGSL
jgi:hydroxyacylglutathione hydrolase